MPNPDLTIKIMPQDDWSPFIHQIETSKDSLRLILNCPYCCEWPLAFQKAILNHPNLVAVEFHLPKADKEAVRKIQAYLTERANHRLSKMLSEIKTLQSQLLSLHQSQQGTEFSALRQSFQSL